MKIFQKKFPFFPRFSTDYKAAIRFYTILLFIAMAVFCTGFIINLDRLVEIWNENENYDLSGYGAVITIMLENVLHQHGLDGSFTRECQDEIMKRLDRFRLGSADRLYLVTRKEVIRLYPRIPETTFGKIPLQHCWSNAWSGKTILIPSYAAWDGKNVKAVIHSIPPYSLHPDYLVVVERERSFFNRSRHIIRLLELFILIGLIGFGFILLAYMRKVIQPFMRLEQIVRDGARKTGTAPGTIGFDPVRRAIETFSSTLNELKEKETQLIESKALLEKQAQWLNDFEEHVLSYVDTGVITFDRNRCVQSLTTKIYAMLGLNAKDDPRGKSCDQLFGSSSIIASLLTDALKNKKVHENRQWKWQMAGEPVKWLSLSTHLLKDSFGGIIGVGLIVRNITSWKQLEEQVREIKHLAALGELAAGIAHEIRNPLGVINGNADLLADELHSEESLELVRDIKTEIANLDRIIRDFLNFSRPAKLDVTAVDIHEFIPRVVKEYETEFGNRIQFEISIQPRIPKIQLDESLFRQILQNLLTNAVQAIEKQGKISVHCRIENITVGNKPAEYFFVVEISDTGKGIDSNQGDKLFTPFFTTKSNGTGLGLAIVKKLVLLHKGFIDFNPAYTPGAQVVLTIPMNYDPDRTANLR